MSNEIERLNENLRSAKYKFAKTMPWMPHFYTVGDTWESKEEFTWTAHMIKKHGIEQQFFKKPRNYYYLDGWRYWIMSDDPNNSKIFNREREDIRKPKEPLK